MSSLTMTHAPKGLEGVVATTSKICYIDGEEGVLAYRGLDDEERATLIEWSDPPCETSDTTARFEYELSPQSQAALSMAIRCERQRRPVALRAYDVAQSELAADVDKASSAYAIVETSS